MDRAGVQAWLDRYVEAWQQNEAAPIEALFTEDATYRFAPFGEESVARGRAEIVKGWLDNPDPPGTWEAHYEPFAVDGNRAVATRRATTCRHIPPGSACTTTSTCSSSRQTAAAPGSPSCTCASRNGRHSKPERPARDRRSRS